MSGAMVLALIAGAAAGDDVVQQPRVFQAEHVPGEVIVAFDTVPTAQSLAALSQGRPVTSWREIPHAPHPKNNPGGIHPLAYVRVLKLVPGTDETAMAESLLGVPGVRYAHPNYLTEIAFEPNDPAYDSQQYGPQIVEAPGAWDVTMGDASVIVAMADTGINFNHEDFQAGTIYTNPDEIAGNGIDDDNNGYVDDVHGWDAIGDDADATDQGGHGSHTAGTVGARLNNGIGMAGMANVTLMPIQVFSAGGGGTWEAIAEAVFYATDNGANVVSYSGGGGGGDGLLAQASQYAWDNNVSFIAAAGNNNSSSPFYPAYYPTVIAVSGTDSNDQRYTSSNYGDWIDVAAPGVNVYSCWWNGAQAYNTITGTSMSTPHVSGLAALMYTVNPFLTPQDVRDLLRDNAVDLGDPGFDIFFGYGRIDAAATIAATPKPTLAIGFPEGLPEIVDPGVSVSFPVQIDELNETIDMGTETLYVRRAGDEDFMAIALSDMGGGLYEAEIPGQDCGPDVEYYVGVESEQGSQVTSPSAAPDVLYSLPVGTESVLALDTFENDMGWTTEVLGATSGQWQRGVPVNDPGWEYDPTSDGDGSGKAFLTQNEVGNTDVDSGAVRLTSPVYDLSSGNVTISYDYYLYLTDNGDGADELLVEIAAADNNWIEIASHSTSNGTSWAEHAIDQADLDGAGVVLTNQMRVRFTANDAGAQNIVEAGVDHFQVASVSCDDGCVADFNGDGSLNILDFVAYQTAFIAGDDAADVNGDGELNVLDFVAFQAAFVAGCA